MRDKNGSLTVITGCMFSGKSLELIRIAKSLYHGGIQVQVFKHSSDTRYASEEMASHLGARFPAIPVATTEELVHKLNIRAEAFFIDEAQFFIDDKEAFADKVRQLADLGFKIWVAGLNLDFRGEPFGPMGILLGGANSADRIITPNGTICAYDDCRAPASRTQRIINGKPAFYEDPIVLVGASEAYEPRCRMHHEVPHRSDATHTGTNQRISRCIK